MVDIILMYSALSTLNDVIADAVVVGQRVRRAGGIEERVVLFITLNHSYLSHSSPSNTTTIASQQMDSSRTPSGKEPQEDIKKRIRGTIKAQLGPKYALFFKNIVPCRSIIESDTKNRKIVDIDRNSCIIVIICDSLSCMYPPPYYLLQR